uniref:Uncharacterized protein n=1 Tax=Glycine max TaxID=3847 RepID=C6SWJ3_SOYBN|nr:unknown [Glycine max]
MDSTLEIKSLQTVEDSPIVSTFSNSSCKILIWLLRLVMAACNLCFPMKPPGKEPVPA